MAVSLPLDYFQVFFRYGVLNQLEVKRDELLSDRVIQLQACCRGYLARRKIAQRRVQVIYFLFLFSSPTDSQLRLRCLESIKLL